MDSSVSLGLGRAAEEPLVFSSRQPGWELASKESRLVSQRQQKKDNSIVQMVVLPYVACVFPPYVLPIYVCVICIQVT